MWTDVFSGRYVTEELDALRSAFDRLEGADFGTAVVRAARLITGAVAGGGKVLFCGNGGSAAEAQHLAAELVGRQNYDRPPAAGLSLTVDTSALTAIGNDYGYDDVFARQVEALGRPGDVLWASSTSGRSVNVVRALHRAQTLGIGTIASTGADPRDLAGADVVLAVPAHQTAHIQELQLVAGHLVFGLVERALYPAEVPGA